MLFIFFIITIIIGFVLAVPVMFGEYYRQRFNVSIKNGETLKASSYEKKYNICFSFLILNLVGFVLFIAYVLFKLSFPYLLNILRAPIENLNVTIFGCMLILIINIPTGINYLAKQFKKNVSTQREKKFIEILLSVPLDYALFMSEFIVFIIKLIIYLFAFLKFIQVPWLDEKLSYFQTILLFLISSPPKFPHKKEFHNSKTISYHLNQDTKRVGLKRRKKCCENRIRRNRRSKKK